MLKKCSKCLLVILTILLCFISCSSNNKNEEEKNITLHNASELTKDNLDKTKELITGDNTSDKIVEKYKDIKKVSDYNLNSLINGIKESGKDVIVIAKEKDFFDAPKFELKVGESTILAYDYEELITLRKDISAISDNGMVISESKTKWNYTPHFFCKGEMLVVYDGNCAEIIDLLNELVSNELY